MKLEKKHWIIIGVVVAIIAVWYFFLRKKKAESGYNIPKKPIGPGSVSYPDGSTGTIGTAGRTIQKGPRIISTGTLPTAGKTIGLPGGHGNKCYCGTDDSTPPREVWNFTCCNKATA